MRLTAEQARRRLASARVARLATIGPAGPRVVPVCFAVEGDLIWSAIDHKPKRTRRPARLADVAADPRVAVLADHYEDEDWARLWWARADGTARVLDAAPRAVEALAARYAQYRATPPAGPVLEIAVHRWSGWSGIASPHTGR